MSATALLLRNTVSPTFVGDDDRLRQRVERAAEPDSLGTRFGDGLGGPVGGPLDIDEDLFEISRLFGRRVRPKPRSERLQTLAQAAATPSSSEYGRHRQQDEDDDSRDDDVVNLQMKDGVHPLQHCRPSAPQRAGGLTSPWR